MALSSKSERPRIELPYQSVDYTLEILSVLGLLALWGLAAYYYPDLPEQIPVHFGASGYPDRFGSKQTLWLLPGIGLAIYSILSWINLRPDRFNYMVDITEENAERQYRLATRLIRTLKVLLLFIFTFLVNQTIHVAQGPSGSMNFWIFLLLIATTLGLTFYNVFKSVAQK